MSIRGGTLEEKLRWDIGKVRGVGASRVCPVGFFPEVRQLIQTGTSNGSSEWTHPPNAQQLSHTRRVR